MKIIYPLIKKHQNTIGTIKHSQTNKKILGFTLMEMLITISIIAILTSIAIPSFSKYLKRAHYTEITQATTPFKLGIAECFQLTSSLEQCPPGTDGVPPNLTSTNKNSLISSIETNNGTITATPKNKKGFSSKDTYILTPTDDNGILIWQKSGGAIDNGYTK